jgi:hypothetical protein
VFFTKYYYDNQIKEDKMGGACSARGGMRNAHISLVGEPEGERPPTSGHKWEDNINMDHREIGLEGESWIHVAQDRD